MRASCRKASSIGLGVKTTAVRNVHIQGGLTSTGNNLDLALTGNGWFQIEGADGETLYTAPAPSTPYGAKSWRRSYAVTLDVRLLTVMYMQVPSRVLCTQCQWALAPKIKV